MNNEDDHKGKGKSGTNKAIKAVSHTDAFLLASRFVLPDLQGNIWVIGWNYERNTIKIFDFNGGLENPILVNTIENNAVLNRMSGPVFFNRDGRFYLAFNDFHKDTFYTYDVTNVSNIIELGTFSDVTNIKSQL